MKLLKFGSLLLLLIVNAPAEPLGEVADVTPAAGWRLAKNDRPLPLPTFKYLPPAGRKAALLLSLIPASRAGVVDTPSLRRFHVKACTPFLPSPDYPVDSLDLKPAHGTGVYATFTDPKLAGKAAGPDDYKTATSACLFLGGDLLVQATLLCDDPSGRDFSEALDMVRSITASGNIADDLSARGTRPPAKEPGMVGVVPPEGFVESPLPGDARPGSFAYVNAQGVVLTGWLDRAARFNGMRAFWTAEKARIDKGTGMPIRNEALRLVGGWSVVSYEMPLAKNLVQRNLRACKTVGDAWIDLHLSGPGDQVTEAGLDAVLTGIKLEPPGKK